MQRTEIRRLKRNVRGQGDIQAMLALLERSVRFGHRRLALLRCIQAEQMGITVTPHILEYCQDIADRMPREELEKFVRSAVQSDVLWIQRKTETCKKASF